MLLCLWYGCGGRDLRCSLHLRFACGCSSSCISHGFGFGGHGSRPCHRVVVVRCSMLPDGPLQEKDSIGISTAGFLYLAVVVSFWIIARFDRCRTDSAHAMPPAWPGCAHLAEKIQSVPRQRLFRDATESKVKTTKHLHTGHQTASVNTYLLLCDLGDR